MLFFLYASLFVFARAQESRYNYGEDFYNGPYKQIYPPVDITRDYSHCQPNATVTCPIFLALMFSFGGLYASSGVIPGIQIALDQINDNPDILPGYSLHYVLQDSQCSRTRSLSAFLTNVLQPPTKVGVIGSGCSIATEVTAELAPFYNLTQISCVSSSIALANRNIFSSHFQISESELNLAFGFLGMIKEYRWKRVALLVEDENMFTETVDKLRLLLNNTDVDIREKRFESSDGVDSLGEQPFDSESRIFILSMFPIFAREVLCRAHQQRRLYPHTLFIVEGWYPSDWWKGTKEEQQKLRDKYDGCTVDDREAVARYVMAPHDAGRTSPDPSHVADSGLNETQIDRKYRTYLRESRLNLTYTDFYQQCYDATWTLGRALNNTLTDIRSNSDLSANLTQYNRNLQPDEKFGLQHFTYNNSRFFDVIFGHLQTTDFQGIVGPIRFDSNGLRIVNTVDIFQYRPVPENGTVTKRIADIRRENGSDREAELIYLEGESKETVFPLGVPFDGVPCEEIVTVHPALTAIFTFFAIIGIALALVGITIQLILRNKVIIGLSSPNLNVIIGIGAIILYIDIIITVMPTKDIMVQTVFCNITPWLTAIGYSLCYGTILVKMARVYYIFDNPMRRKKRALQDWMLSIGVVILVMIDLIILTTYTLVEGIRDVDRLAAHQISNPENRQDIIGVHEKVLRYFVLDCHSLDRSITLGVLYGYKMVLQIIALIIAFTIRKVKIKGLNDTKYIAVAVYITSIITAMTIVITFTLDQHINIFGSIFGIGFFIVTTVILGLVMLPPIIGHIQDPKGEKVFLRSTEAGTNNNSLNPVSFPLQKKSGTNGGSSSSGEDRAPPFFIKMRPKSNSISVVDSQRQKSNSLSISDDSVEALKKKIIELEKIISYNQDSSADHETPPVTTHKSRVVTISEDSSTSKETSNERSNVHEIHSSVNDHS